MENQENSNEINDDASKWIFGIFYFNPADKRLLPPKRVKWLGWTVNFANPYSVGLFVLFVVALVYLPTIVRTISGH